MSGRKALQYFPIEVSTILQYHTIPIIASVDCRVERLDARRRETWVLS